MTYCGDPEAFYTWSPETQERVLGWLRARQPKKKRELGRKVAGTDAGRAFWGLE